jgi:hypothetical protein
MVLPLIALQSTGAHRDLKTIVESSADVMSWLTAPERTRLWGPILDLYPRGEARLFPGLVTPILVLAGVVGAVMAVRAGTRPLLASEVLPAWWQARARVIAVLLLTTAAVAWIAAITGGWFTRIGPFEVRIAGLTRPLLLLAAGLVAAFMGWPRSRLVVVGLAPRREIVPIALMLAAAWLSLGPVVTVWGWPVSFPSAYRVLYEYAPGFSSGRSPARFGMIAACFGALAAAWGLRQLRTSAVGRRAAWALAIVFLVESSPVPLPLSLEWPVEGVSALPRWQDGKPTPIVEAIRALPDEAVLAVLPFGEIFHETRAMFDSTAHWRRMLNGYSSWVPIEYAKVAFAARDPLRRAPEALEAFRAAGATHIVVHESGWVRDKGPRVTERLVAAGARPVARAGDVALLAIP